MPKTRRVMTASSTAAIVVGNGALLGSVLAWLHPLEAPRFARVSRAFRAAVGTIQPTSLVVDVRWRWRRTDGRLEWFDERWARFFGREDDAAAARDMARFAARLRRLVVCGNGRLGRRSEGLCRLLATLTASLHLCELDLSDWTGTPKHPEILTVDTSVFRLAKDLRCLRVPMNPGARHLVSPRDGRQASLLLFNENLREFSGHVPTADERWFVDSVLPCWRRLERMSLSCSLVGLSASDVIVAIERGLPALIDLRLDVSPSRAAESATAWSAMASLYRRRAREWKYLRLRTRHIAVGWAAADGAMWLEHDQSLRVVRDFVLAIGGCVRTLRLESASASASSADAVDTLLGLDTAALCPERSSSTSRAWDLMMARSSWRVQFARGAQHWTL